MKRTILSFIMIWILAVSACGAALSASAQTAQSGSGGTASAAQTSQTAVFSDGETGAEPSLELFMPGSYEQYLELENPSDFAINDSYIAIADGYMIYLYDRNAGNYKTFQYTNAITSLNFYSVPNGGTYLYFATDMGATNPIQYIDCTAGDFSDQKPTDTGIESCSTFIINGSTVCFANAQNALFLTTIQEDLTILPPDSQEDPLFSSTAQVSFALYNDTIYFAASNAVYYITGNAHSSWFTITDSRPITSFAVLDGTCYFSSSSNGNSLWEKEENRAERAVTDNETPITGVSAIHCYNDTLYLIQNSSIRSFSGNGFGSYEITKYSDRLNRLGENASDLSVYGKALYLADTRNGRVLKYENGAYSLVCTPTSPELICAGDEVIAVYGNSSVLSVYELNQDTGTYEQRFSENVTGITDIAYSYGIFYAVTSSGIAYKIEETDGSYTLTNATLYINAPKSISADIAGNLYILSADSNVYRMTAEQFMNGVSQLRSVAVFGNIPVKQIACDYNGAIYGIIDNAIYLGTMEGASLLAELSFLSIAYGTNNAIAYSFAFGFEDSAIYLLSDGFIAKADLGGNAPSSLSSIGAAELYANLHRAPAGEDEAKSMLVSVPEGSVILPVADMNAITDSTELFPYTGYARTDETRIGVRICTLDAGTVVAFYRYTPAKPTPAREYTVALVLDDARSAGDDIAVLTDRYTSAASRYTGYTTNEVGLYRFPLLHTGNGTLYAGDAAESLAQSTPVTVYGTVSALADESTSGYGLDFNYYLVTANIGGETVYGFIPTNYVLSYDTSSSWENGEFTFRHIKRGETVTLTRTEGTEVLELSLSDEEQVKVYGEPDENNEVYVTYTTVDGDKKIVWSGMVNADLLYEAGPSTLVILAVVAVVAAAVLVSTCYLILRKQPTLQ